MARTTSGISWQDISISLPPKFTLNINGDGGSNILMGHSPAMTVLSGNVVVTGVTFTNNTDTPTILVQGGNLVLRNDTVEETAAGSQAAIAIAGGTLDLGTASSPGGNVLVVNGSDEFVHNTTPNLVPMVGDSFNVIFTPTSPVQNQSGTPQLPQNFTDTDVLRTIAQSNLELQALLDTGIRAGDGFINTQGKKALWDIDTSNNPTYQIPVLLQMLSAQNQGQAAALYHDLAQWTYWGWQAVFTMSLDMVFGKLIDAATASALITNMQQYAQRIQQNPLATTFLGGELMSAEAQVLGVEFATEEIVALLQGTAGGMSFQPLSLQPILPV